MDFYKNQKFFIYISIKIWIRHATHDASKKKKKKKNQQVMQSPSWRQTEVTQRETVIWELSAWSKILATTWQDSLITLWNVIFFLWMNMMNTSIRLIISVVTKLTLLNEVQYEHVKEVNFCKREDVTFIWFAVRTI